MQPWQKLHPLSDQNAFICLVDHMGDDSSIVRSARVSYGKDEREPKCLPNGGCAVTDGHTTEVRQGKEIITCTTCGRSYDTSTGSLPSAWKSILSKADRALIRYLMNHQHTTPFEMVEIVFMVQVPMDCWRQWIRHRTANVNEYSTRYTEALDFFQVTEPTEWRLQATDNKQGSSGYLEEWPEGEWEEKCYPIESLMTRYSQGPGEYLSQKEYLYHEQGKQLYQERLALGVAKEQARKDLPLSTYTRAYWKCDLHNIFNFLRLRMDSHAQLEIRSFANSMFEIVKSICPVACEAFEDYVLHAKRFSRMEMEVLKKIALDWEDNYQGRDDYEETMNKPSSLTDREWKDFLEKLQ